MARTPNARSSITKRFLFLRDAGGGEESASEISAETIVSRLESRGRSSGVMPLAVGAEVVLKQRNINAAHRGRKRQWKIFWCKVFGNMLMGVSKNINSFPPVARSHGEEAWADATRGPGNLWTKGEILIFQKPIVR